MNIWDVLKIEQTKDKDALKKAYRMRLSSVNPEDDPEGFMELRKAYEEAVHLADQTEEEFDVLAFCMNVLPQNRPQNMDALLQIVTHPAGKTPPVRDVPKTEPVRPETRNLQPPKPDPGRPLPKWLITGIAAAVAVIALIISVGSGGKKSTPASSRYFCMGRIRDSYWLYFVNFRALKSGRPAM